MNSSELRKQLKQAGIGGWFGKGIRLFDTEYAVIPLAEMDHRVESAMGKLAGEGLVPQEDYAENGGDCDSFVVIIMAEVYKQWMKEHQGLSSYPALAFGRAIDPGHDINIGVTEQGIFVWNYGTRTEWSLTQLTEVEFK